MLLLLQIGKILIVTISVQIIHVWLASSHTSHHGGHVHPTGASHSSHSTHATHASHSTHSSSKASHVLHHLLKVPSTSRTPLSLGVTVILVLPLAKVHLQPMLLGLLGEEPLPVRALLSLFQRKLDAPRPHLVFGCLRVHLFQELHVQLKSRFLSAPSAFKDKRVFLHLYLWVLNVGHVDGEENDLWPLSP